MDRINTPRRKFIGLLLKSSVYSAVAPVFFSAVTTGCTSARIGGRSQDDDLKKLQKAIADKEHPLKWVFTGDSITQGAKHTLGYRSYPEIFSERIRFEM